MIHVLQLLTELIIFLAALLILLDYGPVDVHLLASAMCGGLFLVAIRGVVVIGTVGIRLVLGLALVPQGVQGRVRRWWTPPGQLWKEGGDWWTRR